MNPENRTVQNRSLALSVLVITQVLVNFVVIDSDGVVGWIVIVASALVVAAAARWTWNATGR